MKTIVKILCGAALSMLWSSAALAQAPSLDARVSLNIADQELAQVVQYLRERSGANIVLLEGGDRVIHDLQIKDVHWREALEYAVQLAECVLDEERNGVLTITKPSPVTFTFTDRPIGEIIDTIGSTSGANIIVSPEVTGNLSVRLKDVPWRDALESIVKARGYTVVEEAHGILRVMDPALLSEQMVTRFYKLRYLRPRGDYEPVIKSEFLKTTKLQQQSRQTDRFTVLDAFRSALSVRGANKGDLRYIEDENVLIVTDTVQVHDQIQEIVNRLDLEPPQVFIDVKFVSTINADLLNLGIDYGDSGPQATLSGSQIPISFPFNLGEGGFEDYLIANELGEGPFADDALNAGTTLFPSTIFGALSFVQFQATLRLLQRDTRSEVIQAPRIITLDGNEATIFVGETVRYAEAKSEQGQAGGLLLSVAEAGGSPVEIGFQLFVRPHVVPGTEQILLEIIPKETSLSGASVDSSLAPAGFDIFTVGAAGLEGSIALPRTRASTMLTHMMLDGGQTAVIGGLTTDTDTKVLSRVPYLSRIPIIGELFKHRSETRDRRSLIIFLTPKVVHSREDTEYLLQEELLRRDRRLHDELKDLYKQAESDN